MKNESGSLKVCVFGGTGYYGEFIVNSLLAKEVTVTVVSRNHQNVINKFGSKVKCVEGDIREEETIALALMDQDAAIISVSAMSWDLIKQQKSIERDAVLNIISIAQMLNLKRLLYLSGYEIRMDVLEKLKIQEFGAIKKEIELTLAASGLNYTILGCAPAFRMFFALLKNGKITIPGGGRNKVVSVAAEDVGELTAQTVMKSKLSKRRIRLTAAEAFSIPEVAELMSEHANKTIGVRAIPLNILRVISYLIKPFNPFLNELFKTLKLFNNFPPDLIATVKEDHQYLLDTFDYAPKSLDQEIKKYFESENRD